MPRREKSEGGTMTAPALLTPAEAAARLQVSEKTLRRLRDRGLRYVMLSAGSIRYRAEDLSDFIEARVQQCRSAPKTPASGTTTSRSKVVDFTALAGRTPSKTPRR
jgi:excisionase family DNA binding protein